jgi:hypothetical protein
MCVCVCVFSRVASGLTVGLVPVQLPHRMPSGIIISEVDFGLKQSRGPKPWKLQKKVTNAIEVLTVSVLTSLFSLLFVLCNALHVTLHATL